MSGQLYEAVGETVEEALAKIHKQIPPREGADYAITRVVDWGAQYGGFAQALSFWVRVEVDEYSPFKT